MYGAIDWEAIEWEDVVPGIRRKVVHLEGGTLVLNRLEPGNEPVPHSHSNEQAALVLSGKMALTVDGVTTVLGPGDVYTIKPDVEHYGVTDGDEVCINLDFFVPRREDYKAGRMKDRPR